MPRLVHNCLLLCALGALGATYLAAQDVAAPYVGSETCSTCHEDIFNAFKKSPHHVVDSDKKRGWENKACESCHGPAMKHTESLSAEDIRNPSKISAVAADKVCMTCHLNQPTHVGRLESSHARDQVSCVSCHPVHANGPQGMVTRAPVASCSTLVAVQPNRASTLGKVASFARSTFSIWYCGSRSFFWK